MNAAVVRGLLLAVGFLLIAVANGMILFQVNANRKGEAEARLWLTEREMPQAFWLAHENSGMELRLVWRTLSRDVNGGEDRMPSWLSGKKLEELGFRFVDGLSVDNQPTKVLMSKKVYLVLEYNGPAYQTARRRVAQILEREEAALRANPADRNGSIRLQAKKRIRAEEQSESRLFVIDAGLDPQPLRTSYPETNRFIVTPGVIELMYRTEGGRQWAAGAIRSISPDTVHVPLEHRVTLEQLAGKGKFLSTEGKAPRYEVELVYGSRRVPWIAAIRPLAAPLAE